MEDKITMMLLEVDRLESAVKEMLNVLGVEVEDLQGDMPELYEEYNSAENTLRGMIMAHVKN